MELAVHRRGRVVRFGIFEADLEGAELRRRGSRVRIQERPFRILETLLSRPGEVVTRTELRERLWPKDTFVDFEHGLNAAMNKLRGALGDSASKPRFIETVPRRGYRFLASPWQPEAPAEIPAGRVMLAVLPFRNASADPQQELFTDGLTQEMVIRLGGLCRNRLGVIATPSVQRYRDGDRSPERIARELGVDYVLEGNVRRSNGRVRIGAQLVQVRDRTIVWADSLERDWRDEFVLQREVAAHVAGSLAVEFLPEEKVEPERPIRNSDWRELYLMGRHWLGKRTPESLRRALDSFEKSAKVDPGCPLSLAAIAETLALGVEYGLYSPGEALPRARDCVLLALETDARAPDAYTTLAFLRHRWEWDWSAAESTYLKSLSMNPSCATALHQYGQFLSHVGRHDEGVDAVRRALVLDPYSLVIRSEEACLLVNAGRADEALEVSRRLNDMAPEFAVGWNSSARALLALHRWDEAVAAAETGVRGAGGTPYLRATLAVARAHAGDRDGAERTLHELRVGCSMGYYSPVLLARVHAALGDAAAAVGLLEKGYRTHAVEMSELAADPEWRVLRGEPRYEELLDRLAFPVRPTA